MFLEQLKIMREGVGDPAGGGGAGGDPAAAAGGTGGGDPAAAAAPTVSIPENWKDSLPEEFRKEPSMAHIKTLEDLSKSYIHAQKSMGANKVVIPDPKFATDADWKAFYSKVGLPADAKDYKITPPKGFEDMFEPEFIGEFAKTAHEMNIMPGQAQKLLAWYGAREKQQSEAVRAQHLQEIGQGLQEYKTKVGAAYDKKVLFANKALEKFGGPEGMKWAGSNPSIGNNPVVIEMLSKIGEQLFGEDTFDGDDKVRNGMTPEDARSKRNEIMGDKDGPYWNAQHPKHQEIVGYVNKLIEMENPGR